MSFRDKAAIPWNRGVFGSSRPGDRGDEKGSDVVVKKLGIVVLSGLLSMAGCAWGAGETAFRMTPEAAALLKERGSVGYLYWGAYRDC